MTVRCDTFYFYIYLDNSFLKDKILIVARFLLHSPKNNFRKYLRREQNSAS